jgi:hypothetical protein
LGFGLLFGAGVSLDVFEGYPESVAGKFHESEVFEHSFRGAQHLAAAAFVEAGGDSVAIDILAVVESEVHCNLVGTARFHEQMFDRSTIGVAADFAVASVVSGNFREFGAAIWGCGGKRPGFCGHVGFLRFCLKR